jgi:hypothetical protein
VDYGLADDEDPADPRAWMLRHPGLGHLPGATVEYLEQVRSTIGAAQFRREYCNLWPTATAGAAVLTPAMWAQVQDDTVGQPGRPCWLGVDITPDRTAAAVAVAWHDGTHVRTGMLWTGGVDDVRRVLTDHTRRWGARVVYDPVTTAAIAEPSWQRLRTMDYLEACSRLVDAVRGHTVRVRPDQALDIAVGSVTTRRVGDGWAWARRRSAADISPLVAVTLAHHAAATVTEPVMV